MAFIDERGRVFGRINLIDGAVALAALAIVLALGVGYALFRLPAAPVIERVEPSTATAGKDLRFSLRGRNFLPFMRVFIQRTGESAKAIHELDPRRPADKYTLVNSSAAQFFVESPSVAEVRLIDELGPGTYDLAFYNETQQLTVKIAALTIVAAKAPPPPPAVPTATVRVYGSFNGLDPASAGAIKAGDRLTTPTAGEGAEILSVDRAQGDSARVQIGKQGFVPATFQGKVVVPAVLRLRCSVVGTECHIGGATLAVDLVMALTAGDHSLAFTVSEVSADLPAAVRDANVSVRFLARPDTSKLISPGDVDDRLSRDHAPRAARIESVGQRRQATSHTGFYVTDVGNGQQVFNFDEPVETVDTVVRVPLVQVDAAWFYKGQPIKAGGAMVFETPSYVMRGWILDVSFPGEARAPSRVR